MPSLVFCATDALAADYPAKPVRAVVATRGTGSHFCARYVGQKRNERWTRPAVL